MDADQYMLIQQQHVELLAQMNVLWVAFVILVFMQIIGLLTIVGLAAWSVTRVTMSTTSQVNELRRQWDEQRADMRQAMGIIVKTLKSNAETTAGA